MLLPRLSALAEVVWSTENQRDYGSFQHRMKKHYARLTKMGVNYRNIK